MTTTDLSMSVPVRVRVERAPEGWRWKTLSGNHRVTDRSTRTYATFGKARAAASRRYPDLDVEVIGA